MIENIKTKERNHVPPAPEDIEATLQRVSWGTMTLQSPERPPYSVPVSFSHGDDKIFMHGGASGKKISYLRDDPNVQFLVVDKYSFIPSYFSGNKLPCYAGQCFVSLIFSGKATTDLSSQVKISALNTIVEKLQPEGKYTPLPITKDDDNISKMLSRMAIIELSIEAVSAKFQFCQAFNEDETHEILTNLKARGTEADLRTIEMIRKYHS